MAAHSLNPVFLLGPGRSGTTLLYKLLCLHPDAAFISNYDTHVVAQPFLNVASAITRLSSGVRRRAWFSAEGQAYLTKRPLLHRLVPMPVEGEVIYRACGLKLDGNLSPVDGETRKRLRLRFSQIQNRHRACALILKRTANNRRIPSLDSAFPEAKFIVIWRDGRAVAQSLTKVNWWLDHRIWWAGDKTPRELRLDCQGMLELAARNWLEEVTVIERGLAKVEPTKVLVVRFEALLERPEEIVASILRFSEQEISSRFLSEVRQIGLRPGGEHWKSTLLPAEISAIERIQSSHLRILSYL
ncbi:MAG: sulfotransferase [Acidobacteria bacterium]|nr:sulfotransferase [Acidobacteriota bacterium]